MSSQGGFLGSGSAGQLAADTDGTLAANSDSSVATQKAVVTYVAAQVAAAIALQNWKPAVRVATTANGTISTAFANGQTVDGVTLATGDRILLKNQSSASANGIYVVAASGSPTRATDADASAEVLAMIVAVREGTTNADTTWVCTNDSVTLGSTSLTFQQFSSISPTFSGLAVANAAAGGNTLATFYNSALAGGNFATINIGISASLALQIGWHEASGAYMGTPSQNYLMTIGGSQIDFQAGSVTYFSLHDNNCYLLKQLGCNGKDIDLDATTGTKLGTVSSQKLGFWGASPVVQQTDGAALTNSVTSGGTTNTIPDFTNLTVYATDAAAIRNGIYQLARKLKIVDDALRLIGILS